MVIIAGIMDFGSKCGSRLRRRKSPSPSAPIARTMISIGSFRLDPALISFPFEKLDKAFIHGFVDAADGISDQRIAACFRPDLNVKADLFDGLVTAILLRHAMERGKEVGRLGHFG